MQNKLLFILLLPATLLYGGIIRLRNFMFDKGWMGSKKYALPVICVGNLKVGGTGKTPHIEYLVRLLSEQNKRCAALSRGYGRQSKGYQLASDSSDYTQIGDEPAQFKQKFGDKLTVAVDGNRQNGIAQLLQLKPAPEVILLDDAFQHRKVQPSLSILLTRYGDLYSNDYMVPSGRLREPRSGAKRADLVVVTKCPNELNDKERNTIQAELNLQSKQQLFFSYLSYSAPIPAFKETPSVSASWKNDGVLLLTGIATPQPLLDHLKTEKVEFEHLPFPDHHDFTDADLQRIRKIFDNIAGEKKIVLTTEKDAVRLFTRKNHPALSGIDVYYLEIEVVFHGNDGAEFDKTILEHAR